MEQSEKTILSETANPYMPKFIRIKTFIEEKILSGEFVAGQLIPSEKELPDRLPSTIEKAVEDQKRKQIEYVRENKIKLLKGFIESMEETLQRISSS